MTGGILSATITLNCRHDAFTDIRNVGDAKVRLTGLSGRSETQSQARKPFDRKKP